MVYENCEVGKNIYKHKGRLFIYIKFPNNRKTVMSYPKYLMECHLGRYFTKDETVDHIDGNPLNNNLENLQVLDRSEHCSLDAKMLLSKTFICPICQKEFTLEGNQLSRRITERKRNKAGPFCSRKCAGIYGAEFQNNRMEKLEVIQIIPEYSTRKNT